MRVPLNWLNELVATGPDLEARLTLTGTKVEAIHHHGVSALEHFVVGKVVGAEKHPDADRLTVCQVDTGAGPSQIVCGADNVAAGQTVAVATPGAVMPDGTKLKAAKLRGEPSNGMILAEDELGIGGDHWGIMVLDDSLPAGTPLLDVLPIATEVYELEITPNRPDCLSVYGVAREVHAATGVPLAPPPWADDPVADQGDSPLDRFVSLEVHDAELCPRFTLRAFEDVKIGPSPVWLKARLSAAGQRPINNVVDITNYVMLLTGQPLHAFDTDRVEGGKLVVRRAKDGEKVTTLDDIERTLDAEMLVIDDAAGPTSIAGVMGGNRSEVHEGTSRVLMEAATWNGPNVQRTSTKLALRSEASGRFEKGLSTGSTLEAQAVAARLMVELTGARLVPGTIDVRAAEPEPATLHLREHRPEELLGVPIARAEQARILEALGFVVTDAGDGLDVTVPHFRAADVTREVDLVEEVGRIDGFDKLPETLPARRGAVGVLYPEQRARRRVEDALIGAGLYEVVGWSFTSTAAQARLGTSVEPIRLKNPMSEEQAVMRTQVLTSLLQAAETNARRGMPDVRLFEIGSVYLPRDDAREAFKSRWVPVPNAELPDERTHLAAILAGAVRPPSFNDSEPPRADIFAAKGVLEALAKALRVDLTFEPTTEPFLHPGRAARVLADGTDAGWLGELHPSLAEAAAFEVDLGILIDKAQKLAVYQDLTSFPENRRDLSLSLSEAVPSATLLGVIEKAGGKLLRSAEVFDVYERSLAIRLRFRAADRTLTDAEVDTLMDKILGAVSELGATRRD